MDYAAKPSLAFYDPCRPDSNFPRPSTVLGDSVGRAKDSGQALLAVIEHQSKVAAAKLQAGHAQQAVALLRRAYQLALEHGTPEPPNGDRPLVVRLALASVRLQLCAVLSQIGRHPQAMEEASLAKAEIDELWRIMNDASIVAEGADAQGDITRPVAYLRQAIRSPPQWLRKAVEVSVQTRLCLAVEMEYILPEDQFQVAADAAAATDAGRPVSAVRPGSAGNAFVQEVNYGEGPTVGFPKADLAQGQIVAKLYAEASTMA
ncbi:unnamed protein product, partial [Polarella glacialis]